MAVAFDVVGPGASGVGVTGTSTSWSHTCSGSNRLLTVGVAIGAASDTGISTSVTYNGVAMTSAAKVHSGAGTAGYIEFFYLIAPSTGSNTVAVTVTGGSVDIEAGSVSFTGVDQTSPLTGLTTNTGVSTSANVAISNVSGNMVVDAVCCGSGFSTGTTQTKCWEQDFNSSTAAGSGAQSISSSTGSVTMSYNVNSDSWGIIGASVVSAAVTPTVTTQAVTSIGPTAATGNGTVVSDGGSTITERGVCWSTSVNPTTSNNKASTSGTTGSYNVSMTGLSNLTLYHVRAYAINANGTSYGGDVTFINVGATIAWLSA